MNDILSLDYKNQKPDCCQCLKYEECEKSGKVCNYFMRQQKGFDPNE